MPACFSNTITLGGAFFEKILLVDDNIDFLKLLSNLLQKNFDIYINWRKRSNTSS